MMIASSLRHSRNRGAAALAEVRVVTLRPDDPVVPAHFFEAHVEGLPAALLGVRAAFQCAAVTPFASVFGVEDQEWTVLLVEGERCTTEL